MKPIGDQKNLPLFDRPLPNPYSMDLETEFREPDGLSVVGELQQAVRQRLITSIHVDLTKIEWVDPIPLLMLLSVLGEFSKSCDSRADPSVVIDLGGHDIGEPDHKLCLKFLASHGFVHLFSEVGKVKWRGIVEIANPKTGKEEWTEKSFTEGPEIVDQLMRYAHSRHFSNSVLLPARLIPLNKATENDDLLHDEVECLFVQMRTHARTARFLDDSSARDILFQKVRTLLYELLLNVGEHAYPSIRPHGLAAVYARIHGRRPENADQDAVERWDELFRADRTLLPGMRQFDPSPNIDWVELFICDVGDGLTSKISQWKSSTDNPLVDRAIASARKSKTPLQSLSKRLFVSGFSSVSRDSPTRTVVTGLQHLGHVLALDQDYARIYSDFGTWLGGSHPWRPARTGDVQVLSRREAEGTTRYCSGTAYGIHIQPKLGAVLDDDRWVPISTETREAALDALRGDRQIDPIVTVNFCDRIEDSNCRPPNDDEIMESSKLDDIEVLNIVLRPPKLVGKHDIGRWLDWTRRQIRPLGAFDRCVLYIAELTPSQGAIFLDFIERNYSGNAAKLAIYLITNNWSVTCLLPVKHSGRGFQFRVSRADAASFNSPRSADGTLTLIELIQYLRHFDSEVFWANRSEDRENIVDLIRAGDTVWEETPDFQVVLTRYLDFGQSLVNERRYKACLRALRRVLALQTDSRPMASDQLVDRLILDSNSHRRGADGSNDDRSVVVVGSVCVTGTTATRYRERLDIDVKDQVFLLINSDVEIRPKVRSQDLPITKGLGVDVEMSELRVAALSWMPPDELQTWTDCWARVPNTPFIAPNGGKSLSLVRFRKPTDDDKSDTHYPRSPKQMYRDFDRYGILKLGHWRYQGRHDLITVNLAQAFRYAHIEHGSMFLWLRDQFRTLFSASNDKGEPIAHVLVYPSHPVSDEIIALISTHREFDGCLPKLGIFPVKYLGSHTVSPALASPMLERLVIQATNEIPREKWAGVVFDDGVITGKHQRELSQLLQDLGSASVRTVAFVDRTGLPTRDGIVQSFSKRHRRLWRLDLPTLGHERDCAICGVLQIAKTYRTHVARPQLKARLDDWLQIWGIADVDTQWHSSGVPPVLFKTPQKLKFGITFDQKEGASERFLHLTNSTSFSTALIELTRLTTRADKALERGTQLFEEYPLAAIEIVASQLLLFWDELNYWERRDRFSALLQFLWSQVEESAATALCGLCLLMVDDHLAEVVWDDCLKHLDRHALQTRDAVLSVKMLFHVRQPSSSRTNPFASGNTDMAKANYVLLDLDQKAESALREVIGIAGDRRETWHGSPLREALNGILSGKAGTKDVTFAARQLERLHDVLDGPGFRTVVTATSLEDLRESIVTALRIVYANLNANSAKTALEIIRGEKTAGGDHRHANSLHDLLNRLFLPIHDGCTLYSLIDDIKLRARKAWETMVKEKSGTIQNRWISASEEIVFPTWTCFDDATASCNLRVFFSDHVKQEIRDRLLNVFHAPSTINSPWNLSEDSRPPSDMWIRVAQDGDYLVFDFANSATGARVATRYSVATSSVESVGGDVTHELKVVSGTEVTTEEALNYGSNHTLFFKVRVPLISYFIRHAA